MDYNSMAAQLGNEKEPTANPYDDIIKQQKEDFHAQAALTVGLSFDKDPKREAENLTIARKLGTLPDVVAAYPEEFRQRMATQYAHDILTDAPKLQAHINDNPVSAAVSQNDLHNLSGIERTFAERAARQVAGPFRALAAGVLTDFNAAAWGMAETGAGLVGADSAKAYFSGLRKSQEATGKAIQGDYGSEGFTEGGVASGFRSLGAMVPGLAASIVTGNPQFALGMGAGEAGGQAMGKAHDAGASSARALTYGIEDAGAEYLTELLPMGLLLKDIKAGSSFTKLMGHQMATEVPGEVAATAWQNANEWLNLHPEKSMDDYVKELGPDEGQTVIATVVQTLATGGLAHGAMRLQRRGDEKQAKAEQAVQDFATLQTASEHAKASQTRDLAPDDFKQFVNSVTEDGHLASVYVNGEVFAQSMQAAGVGMEELQKTMPEVASQLQEAIETQGDVNIQTADYLTHIAAGKLGDTLLQHLKVEPDGMTKAEADAQQQTQVQDMTDEAGKEIKEISERAAFDQSKKAVYDQTLAQHNEAGRFSPEANKVNAKIYSEMIGTLAQDHGVTPEEFHAQHGQTLVGTGAGAFEQANTKAGLKSLSDSINSTGIKFDAFEKSGGNIYLSRIEVPEAERNTGKGTDAMQKLVDYADQTGQHITLTPSADFGGNKKRLTEFYKRFGFVENKGKNRAFSTSEGMYRQAQGKVLYQDNQDARGFFAPDSRTIGLLKDADLSTYIHETGHWALDTYAKIASQPDAPVKIKEDMSKLLNWFGIKDDEAVPRGVNADAYEAIQTQLNNLDAGGKLDTPEWEKLIVEARALREKGGIDSGVGVSALDKWNAMSFDEQRQHHEQLARGFEAYFMEGKAPSLELQPAFSRIKSWMLSVYKTLRGLNVELTPEVRTVFDRMLASEDAIKEAEAARGYFMPEKKPTGVTDTAWQELRDLHDAATSEATDEMQARSLRDMKWGSNAKSKMIRKLQREADAQRAVIREAVEKEVSAMPIYRAETWLRKGETTTLEGEVIKLEADAVKGAKFNKEDIAQMFPETMNARPNLDALKGMVSPSGMSPDMIADVFGFSSGDALVRDLLEMEPRESVIEGRTDQRMLEEHGDLIDARAIEQAANEAIHNELRAKFMATGLKMLSKSPISARTIQKGAKEAADAAVAAKMVRNLRPKQYEAAEAKANREALKLVASDPAGAVRAQRSAVLNSALVKSTNEALTDVQKLVEYGKRLEKDAAQKNMRGEMLAQMNALLGRFDLRTSVTQPDANRKPIGQWVQEEADRLSAVTPEIPEWAANESFRTNYTELTVGQVRELRDTLKQLEFLARREHKQYAAIRAMDFAQERGEVLGEIRKHWPGNFDEETGEVLGIEPTFAPKFADAVSKLGDKFAGEFLSPETIITILGGGKFSTVNESLFGRISKRADWKATKLGEVYQELKPYYAKYSLQDKVEFARKDIGTAKIGLAITREKAMGVALLHGHVEGRERLRNYGWGEQQQLAIINLLEDRDLDLVAKMWQIQDEMIWPELDALNKRTRGKSPPKVEAVPYTTASGRTMQGGYSRLKYDGDLDETAYNHDRLDGIKALVGGTFGKSAKTNQGTSTERKQDVTQRPRLDLGVFASAVNESVHDLAYREAVADTMRMLRDKGVMAATKRVVGNEGYRALVNRVEEVATPPMNPSGFVERAIGIARKNTVINLMSGVKTALQNFTGLTPALAELNGGTFGSELAKFYGPKMMERYQFCMDQSEFMRNRFTSFDRDLQKESGRMTLNGSYLPDTSTFLALMGFIDKGVSVPVWNAAFKQGMERFENDTGKAVDYADHVVRQTQGSGREADLAQIMSGHGGWGMLKKAFTMFYSYFNGQLGLLVKHGVIAKLEAKQNPQLATARYAAKFIAIVVLPTILTELLMNGAGPDGEDDEQMLMRYATAFVKYGAGMFPLVRDIVPAIWTKTVDTNAHYFGAKISPIDSAADGVVEGVKSLKDVATGENDEKDTKHLIMAAGYTFGLPGKLVADMADGTRAWLSGDAGPQAVVLGPPKK